MFGGPVYFDHRFCAMKELDRGTRLHQVATGGKSATAISVADGAGKPLEQAEQMFHAFSKSQDTGVGLRISRSIIELYRGSLWATSKFRKRSDVSLHLVSLITEPMSLLTASKWKPAISPHSVAYPSLLSVQILPHSIQAVLRDRP